MTRLFILALAAIILLASCASPSGAELEVYAFSAGKADAFLLTTESGAVLIDTGLKGFGGEILDYLAEKGITRLDYLIITHFDKDHVGGAAKVINNVEIGTVLQSNCPKDSDEYENYLAALENAGIEPVTVREDMSFTLDGVEYVIDAPDEEEYASDPSNNSSLIISVRNGGDSLLFMGDAEKARITEFLIRNRYTYDLIKMPHHGGIEDNTDELIASVKPQYAIITSSEAEPEDAETTELLEKAGAKILLTREGAVTVKSTGSGLAINE